jgi:hypothetical protein
MRINRVCRCSAYDFPHRLTSGKCTGTSWLASYYTYEADECSQCVLNHDGVCQVACGQESIEECQIIQLHESSTLPHPITDEYFYESMEY